MSLPRRPLPYLLVLFCAGLMPACSSAYYGTMEMFGQHKRDILRDRVEAGREDQTDAKEQFQTTFELFKELTAFEGGDLEDVYEELNDAYEDSEDAAEEVTDRIESIEKVAQDLFAEWEEEIETINDSALQRSSRSLLLDTRQNYEKLIGAMRRAEARMGPVLVAFRDQVLFLKHNLNASAINSLNETVLNIEQDVQLLIDDMQSSIDEADEFIRQLSDDE